MDLQRISSRLQDGDLIFMRERNPIFDWVAETTDSWETHVGILFLKPDGTWQVAESRFPFSKHTSLKRFIARAADGRFLVSRCRKELNEEEKLRLRREVQTRMGRFYDLGFNYDSRLMYCSKLVFDAYRDATGRQVGEVTTFRQLFARNPRAPMRFWRAWFFGRIPWDRRCVTTTSELQSASISTVYDSTQAAPGKCKN